jgi:hypothetical protein
MGRAEGIGPTVSFLFYVFFLISFAISYSILNSNLILVLNFNFK